MDLSENYIKYFLIEMAYHSVSIEGYRLSREDAVDVLLNNQRPPSMDDEAYILIDNHRFAVEFILRKATNLAALSFPLLSELHYRCMKQIDPNAGNFKSEQNYIQDNTFKTASPSETPLLMLECIEDINEKMAQDLHEEEFFEILAQFTIAMEHIQPYQLGNRMFLRLIANFLLLRYQKGPCIFTKADRPFFEKQLYQQNISGVAHLLEEKSVAEKQRMLTFSS
ncbi:MAG TPA: Fic family protein [Pseudogracilibacillus sp.]|nr:Fic family protein [Pseudogracilibacillus sp.]